MISSSKSTEEIKQEIARRTNSSFPPGKQSRSEHRIRPVDHSQEHEARFDLSIQFSRPRTSSVRSKKIHPSVWIVLQCPISLTSTCTTSWPVVSNDRWASFHVAEWTLPRQRRTFPCPWWRLYVTSHRMSRELWSVRRCDHLEKERRRVTSLVNSATSWWRTFLVFPFPDFVQELVSSEIVSAQLLFSHQFLLDDDLSSNAGMITAGNPENCFSTHSMPTCECVFQRAHDRMTQMKIASDIRGWNDDGECLSRCQSIGRWMFIVVFRTEEALFLPPGIPGRFDILRTVGLR